MLGGEIIDFGVFERKSTGVCAVGVLTMIAGSISVPVVMLLSQLMGVGVGDAAVTSWDADDDVASKIAVYFDILGD